MLTNNFRYILSGTIHNAAPNYYYKSLKDAITGEYPTFGSLQLNNAFNPFNVYPPYINHSYAANLEGVCIYTGSGTTEPTADDYNLESPYTDVQMTTCTGSSVESSTNTVSRMKTYTATLENKAEENRTISEVGLMVGFPSSSSDKVKLLMAREVLENPITLEPNDTVTFTFRIDF